MQPSSFKSQRGECAKLASGRNAYRAMGKMFDAILKDQPKLRLTMFRSSTNPRTQFIRAVQQMCMFLCLQIALGSEKAQSERSDDDVVLRVMENS
jgi:hypothetical protein